MREDDGWTLELLDEGLEIPGWLFVPRDLDPDEQQEWIGASADALADVPCWDGPPLPDEATRQLLASALSLRAESDSLAILQVWPAMAYAAATCHIDILPSAAMWDWTRTDAVVHRIDEPHIGPGLQIATRRMASLDDVEVELSSVALSFDNGEVTLILGVAETLTPLVAAAMPGLVTLMRNVRLVRMSDGAVFSSIEPAGLVSEDAWDLEGAG